MGVQKLPDRSLHHFTRHVEKKNKISTTYTSAFLLRNKSNQRSESTAKKYGIDFPLKKDSTEPPPRYLVFFKGQDADALTAAFKEFSAKKLTLEQKLSIRKLIVSLKEKVPALNAQREKVKSKDRGITR